MLNLLAQPPEVLSLCLAGVAGGLGHWAASQASGRTLPARVLVANLLITAVMAAAAAYLALRYTALRLDVAGLVLGGFVLGGVWGPAGLWRLAALLAPAIGVAAGLPAGGLTVPEAPPAVPAAPAQQPLPHRPGQPGRRH